MEMVQGIYHAKLNDSQAKSAEEELARKEIGDFISSQSSNKAPGITGVTSVYYKYLWKIMPKTITKAINYML